MEQRMMSTEKGGAKIITDMLSKPCSDREHDGVKEGKRGSETMRRSEIEERM